VKKGADARRQPLGRIGDALCFDREYREQDTPLFAEFSRLAGLGRLGSAFARVDGSIEHRAFQQFRVCAAQRREIRPMPTLIVFQPAIVTFP
jgi:hypothetical protein